jgi:hypothetical protein
LTRLSNQIPKTVVQDAAASSADKEWLPHQPSDCDASEDNASEDHDSEDDASEDNNSDDNDSEDYILGQMLQLKVKAESDSNKEYQAAPEPTADEYGCLFPYPVEGG